MLQRGMELTAELQKGKTPVLDELPEQIKSELSLH